MVDMQVILKTLYRMEFIPLIVSFVSETARCIGANAAEISNLSLASEEAASHIVENYPGGGRDDQFEVICEMLPDGLQIVFSNMGLPVNERGIPRFEAARPEENTDGLRFYLIEKMVDYFTFSNEGAKGWRTVLFKRIAAMRLFDQIVPELNLSPSESAHEKLQVRTALIDDAPGIVELAYRTYRYSYTKGFFYYTDKLTSAIEQGKIISFVAVNLAGKIVGQMVIMLDTGKTNVSEIGAVMIQPEYRRSMGLLQLIKTVQRYVQEHPDVLPFCEVNLVTTHTLSQRVCGTFHFAPMALKLSVHGRAKFLGIEESDTSQRESLLHAVRRVASLSPVRLYVSPRHADLTRSLFDNAAIPIELCTSDGIPATASVEQEFDVAADRDDSCTTIIVKGYGPDFFPHLKVLIFEQESDDIKTIFVRIPAGIPQPNSFDHEFGRLRLFFCGWVVESEVQWSLLYTRLNAQRIDFSRIQLYDPLAVNLRNYVQRCFRETIL